MKKIIVDLANIKSVVEAQNRFWGPFNVVAEDVPFKNPSWDAFWDYFGGVSIPTDEGGEEPINLVVKNTSHLKKLSGRDYNLLLECLNDATDPKKIPGTRFTYELVEDK